MRLSPSGTVVLVEGGEMGGMRDVTVVRVGTGSREGEI